MRQEHRNEVRRAGLQGWKDGTLRQRAETGCLCWCVCVFPYAGLLLRQEHCIEVQPFNNQIMPAIQQ